MFFNMFLACNCHQVTVAKHLMGYLAAGKARCCQQRFTVTHGGIKFETTTITLQLGFAA
jgi:hypothetical protein